MNDEKLKEEVRKACEILKNGGIILYPTDTIWGIGCDATNEAAVKRVYELKHREDSEMACWYYWTTWVSLHPTWRFRTWLTSCWK